METAVIGALSLSSDSTRTAGVLLVAIVVVEFGGAYLLRIVGGRLPRTAFQQTFERAGHAHAGVLVTLGLVCQILADAAEVNGLQASLARGGVPLAAILMPAGFFLSAARPGATRPSSLIVLLYAGAFSLGAGALALGIALLRAS